jgi:glycosyltransferase involved in cell wall biosynthesis
VARPAVLFLLHSGAIGGGPPFLRALAALCRREGYDVHVIVDADGPLLRLLAADGIPAEPAALSTPRRFLRSLPWLIRRVRRLAPDLLHVHGQPAGSLGALAGRLAGVRRILYAAQFPAFHTDFDRFRRARNHGVEWLSARLASRVVCLSRWDTAEYLRRRLAPPVRFVRIPNCVRPEFLRAAPDPLPAARLAGVPPGAPVVGFIGRLTDQKGVEDLIQAMPLVQRRVPEARLVVTGDGPLRPRLEALAQATAPGTVSFLGALEDPLPAYGLASVIAMPSRFEPLGMVAVEALALGKAVVAARVGGLPDIIEDEVTGLLVPPGDPRALAGAIARLLADRALAARLGEAGRRHIQQEFSEPAILPRYARLYADLLADAPPA